MKKLFLLTLCTCISHLSSFGQTQQKAKFLIIDGRYYQNSGDNFSTYSSNGSRSFRYNSSSALLVNFRKGKFIKNNIAHGWGLIYNFQNNYYENSEKNIDSDYFSSNTTVIHTIGLNYFLSRFIPVGKGFYLSAEVNGYVTHDFNKTNYASTYTYQNNISKNDKDEKYNNDIVGIGINVGVRYYPKNKIFINATTSIANANYNWSSNEDFQSSKFSFIGSLDFNSFKLGIGTNF